MKIGILFLSIFLFFFGNAQEKRTDYLNYPYKYLNKNYQITMDSKTFEKAIQKHRFLKERVHAYPDSLAVVLMYELNDWRATREAMAAITYTWDRIPYYTLLKNVEEAKQLARQWNITHPYKLYTFLAAEDNKDKRVEVFFKELKKKIRKIDGGAYDLSDASREEVLHYAFKISPERTKLWEEIQKKYNK